MFVKHENHLPTNSFKYRNGLAAMTALTPDERARGVIATTLGNHGQGVAVAARMLGVKATIFVPRNNNPDKNAAIRDFGAELVEVGDDYSQTILAAEQAVAETGRVFGALVHQSDGGGRRGHRSVGDARAAARSRRTRALGGRRVPCRRRHPGGP